MISFADKAESSDFLTLLVFLNLGSLEGLSLQTSSLEGWSHSEGTSSGLRKLFNRGFLVLAVGLVSDLEDCKDTDRNVSVRKLSRKENGSYLG